MDSKVDKKTSNIILIVVFALMITIPLFFRGLYFERDLLPTIIGICAIFGIWSAVKIKNKEYNIFKDPTDYLLFGIVLLYALSVFHGVNKRAALFEFFRHLIYFIVFVLAKEISTEEKHKKIIINIVLLGGLLVSLVGIGTATGTWNYHGAMVGNRLSSTFQYPNTLAAFVGSLYFLALSMLVNEEKRPIKLMYGALTGTFLFTLILTYSRAMWLIFPIVGLIYFIFTPNNRKLETFIYIFSSAILSLPAALLFARGLGSPNNTMWIYYFIASVGTGFIIFIASLPDKFYRKLPLIYLLIGIALLVIVAAVGVVYAINSTTEIEFVNNTSENKSSSIARNISQTLPLSDYTLEVSYKVDNNSESPYGGRIRVLNIDSAGETTEITSHNIVETSEGEITLEFSTPEDSIGVRLILLNYYSNTSATFKEVKVIDRQTGELVYNVPLKYKYIPESIVSRVASLEVGDRSLNARITFNKDGLKIVKNYPILGTGGGGWVTLYHRYQSYPYWTTLAHNFVLQLWIEIGTIGLLIFILLLLTITYFAVKTYFKEDNIQNRLVILGVYFTLLTMLGHSIIDFDMSLPAYAIVFWTLMALISNSINFGSIDVFEKIKKPSCKLLTYVNLIFTALILISSIQIQSSKVYANRGLEAAENNDVDNTILNFEKASRLDKYNTDYYHDLMLLYMEKYDETEDKTYPQKAYEASQRFLGLSMHNPISYGSIASFLMSVGQIEDSLNLLDRAIELQPMVTDQYVSRGNGYLAVFKYYYQNEEYDKARQILERALEVKETLQEVSKTTIRPLSTNMDLIYSLGESQYYLANFDAPDLPFAMGYNLDFAYFFDIDIDNNGVPDHLHVSKPQGSEISYENMDDGTDKFIRLKNNGEKQGYIYISNIKLEPNRQYLIQIKARGTIDPDTMNVYVRSAGSAEPNQGSLQGVPVYEEWYPHVFEFTTDEDVEPGKQSIRIQLVGNDEGYVDIKELAIFKKDNN